MIIEGRRVCERPIAFSAVVRFVVSVPSYMPVVRRILSVLSRWMDGSQMSWLNKTNSMHTGQLTCCKA